MYVGNLDYPISFLEIQSNFVHKSKVIIYPSAEAIHRILGSHKMLLSVPLVSFDCVCHLISLCESSLTLYTSQELLISLLLRPSTVDWRSHNMFLSVPLVSLDCVCHPISLCESSLTLYTSQELLISLLLRPSTVDWRSHNMFLSVPLVSLDCVCHLISLCESSLTLYTSQ